MGEENSLPSNTEDQPQQEKLIDQIADAPGVFELRAQLSLRQAELFPTFFQKAQGEVRAIIVTTVFIEMLAGLAELPSAKLRTPKLSRSMVEQALHKTQDVGIDNDEVVPMDQLVQTSLDTGLITSVNNNGVEDTFFRMNPKVTALVERLHTEANRNKNAN